MSSNFWTDGDERHKEIAKQFYENIEYSHPKHLSGRSSREFGWCNCSWCATAITYPEYNGPRVTTL